MGGVTTLGTHGAQVAQDQRDLIDSGFSVGASGADGYCGQATVDAIKAAQQGGGIKVDGEMGLATRTMLHKVPSYSQKSTSAIQTRLRRYGYLVAVDGKLGPKTTAGITSFQSRFGLTPDGICGPQTWTALYTR